jgi:cellobiose-specific phosphotransferase system component IIC
VLLTLGRNWANADTNFERSVGQIFAHPWTTPATLSTVLSTPAATVGIEKHTESATRIALVTSMLSSEQDIVSFAPVAANPDVLTSSTRLKVLSLLSNEWTAKTGPAAIRAFLIQAAKVVSSVEVDPSSEILVTADQTSLPVSVSNRLDQDATITLQVRSLSARLTIDASHSSQTVTVDEGAQRRVLIPVSALSNGKAEIIATLVSSTGVQIGRDVTIQVNVQAGWETAGTLIFAALVVGLFAFGIIRTIRKRRKAAREPDAT